MSDEDMPSLWPADNPAVATHITMLQGIISRLANNSASCKTWCLALVSALVSLAGAAHVPAIVRFAVVPVIVFGFLDAMYLAQEQAYRQLFNAVVQAIRSGTYSREHLFETKAPLLAGALVSALQSWSVYPVYLGLLVLYALAAGSGWLQALAGTPAHQ